MHATTTPAIVPLGQTVATPGVLDALNAAAILTCLRRHACGDWGDVDPSDRAANDRALKDGDRLLSSYTACGIKVWVITEWDRSVTTILLPEEY